ncbi:hypothetical protein L218DRAFT_951423 [Marasmius fiardii PR-910]|nr:hypothetical protein L218DRAFT_951423 [Marasmius fiardii PR-910]
MVLSLFFWWKLKSSFSTVRHLFQIPETPEFMNVSKHKFTASRHGISRKDHGALTLAPHNDSSINLMRHITLRIQCLATIKNNRNEYACSQDHPNARKLRARMNAYMTFFNVIFLAIVIHILEGCKQFIAIEEASVELGHRREMLGTSIQ